MAAGGARRGDGGWRVPDGTGRSPSGDGDRGGSASLSPLSFSFLCPLRPRPVVSVDADGWRVVGDDYGQTVGKLQVESMRSTAASLFPQ
jgi:hypothetical protein